MRRAFTLIEILLALGILALLSSVMILSFTTLSRGSGMQEGAIRMEAAIRMARADAANTGKRFRFTFDKTDGSLKVRWEPDPINKHGQFIDYTAASWPEQLPLELIKVNRCTRVGSEQPTTQPSDISVSSTASNSDSSSNSDSTSSASQGDPLQRQSLTFYPDGSCDSAVIELANPDALKDGDDQRAILEIDGTNGNVNLRLFSSQDSDDSGKQQAATTDTSHG